MVAIYPSSEQDPLKIAMERIYSELLNNLYSEKFIDRVKNPYHKPSAIGALLDVNSVHSVSTKVFRSDQKNTQSGRWPSGIRLYKHAGEVT